ncbi:FAS1-like dehydratase domain-containing protein [Pseudonocardia zijingensis]|jgi:hypothetical protein|uniref:MaoC family dehydratase N-terminal domain-containing protein n=1 Tax=Pseudonocardia zijingensis TaxID=153376 RepID=A0ABN1PZ69_9PSEU
MSESEPYLPVEEGAIMLFARALGDENPVYRDREYARNSEFGAVIAPPTFVQSATHFNPDSGLRPRPGEPWRGSGRTPTGTPSSSEGGALRLHAEQHFTYHRVLRAGDELTWTTRPGRTWTKQRRNGDTMTFQDQITEYRDRSGELVITARSVVVELPSSGGSR